MTINTRVREIRKSLKMNQKEFGQRIVASQNYLSSIENGQRDVTEKIIKIICHEFNINEHWLRTGEGEMFSKPATFSFDEMANRSNLTELERAIMRGYMELDPEVRKAIMAKAESIIAARAAQLKNEEDEIEAEVNAYRQELEAEKRAETSSASDVPNKKSS